MMRRFSIMLIACLFVFISTGHAFAAPLATANDPTSQSPASTTTINGTLKKWHPLTLDVVGPTASELDDAPNPFLDYRFVVEFMSPTGRILVVPGFFDGDGNGNGTGNVWRTRFAPDEVGMWSYTVSFRAGVDVAVSLIPTDGAPVASVDGSSGTFTIAPLDTTAPGFLPWGRLAYANGHYLKFADGPYWIKGGAGSPENLFGYAGFDNTVNQPGGSVGDGGLFMGLHTYAPHVTDWQMGDPLFSNTATGIDSKGIIGAINYLGAHNVNSMFLMTMNLGGDGNETYPFIHANNTPYGDTHYDISKLNQWNQVFNHAQEQGVAAHIVLGETEISNELWLDNGSLGVERKLYYRELIARFGYLLALKWNISEENNFSIEELREFTDYIQALDWQGHPIAVHTHKDILGTYNHQYGDSRFLASSIQYTPAYAGAYVELVRSESADAGLPWVVDLDENAPWNVGLIDTNADDLRKEVLYDIYFSGGNVEWYAGYHPLPLGGDIRLEDFSTREAMWDYMWYARRFMQDNLPFWQMSPADHLLAAESATYGGGEVFALAGSHYAIYLPDATATGTLDLTTTSNAFVQRWFNPRTGQFEGNTTTVFGGAPIALGTSPAAPAEDWVVLLSPLVPTAIQSFELGMSGSTWFAPLTVALLFALLAMASCFVYARGRRQSI